MGASLNNITNKRRRHQLTAEINITPLVDVMLVLLIIFMVTSPMLVAGIKVDLPETNSAPISGQDEPISIDIDTSGNAYIQGNKIAINELEAKLKAITKAKYDTRIFIRGDKNVDYGKVMHVVGTINLAGFNKVALITAIKPTTSNKHKI
ncbi:Biopolymer transport protein exbD [Rickettsiales bacterium Ac37b]|nr:Biopolymer transport protein exbD [Rickettsiales bacterium Ac37b]